MKFKLLFLMIIPLYLQCCAHEKLTMTDCIRYIRNGQTSFEQFIENNNHHKKIYEKVLRRKCNKLAVLRFKLIDLLENKSLQLLDEAQRSASQSLDYENALGACRASEFFDGLISIQLEEIRKTNATIENALKKSFRHKK